MAAVMLQAIPSFHANFPKNSLFISGNTSEENIVCKDYCIAHHVDKLCFLPNCPYHIILRGEIDESKQQMNAFCSTYQHVDCLYTLFRYRFSGRIVAKTGQVFDNVQRAVYFNQRNKGADKMLSIAKKDC